MDKLCEPCMREGKRMNSRLYCETCEEVYCNSCSKKHLTYKISLNHIIKPINATDVTPNQQMYEPMSISPSQSIKGDEDLANVSDFSAGYIDMGHAKRLDNKSTGSSKHPVASGKNRLLNQKNVTESPSKISEDIADMYLHPIHSDVKLGESIDKTYEEYPYSYADVRTDTKPSASSQSSADQAIDRKSDKTTIKDIENETADAHVYDEIEEENAKFIIDDTENTYDVVLSKSPFPVDELHGAFRLRLTPTGVELLSCSNETSRINYWQYGFIRRFGANGTIFYLEAGRKCGRWCGLFEFACKSPGHAKVIYNSFNSVIAKRKKILEKC